MAGHSLTSSWDAVIARVYVPKAFLCYPAFSIFYHLPVVYLACIGQALALVGRAIEVTQDDRADFVMSLGDIRGFLVTPHSLLYIIACWVHTC